MGRFYNATIWVEDRERDVLSKHDFTEEIWKSEIESDSHWIVNDLVDKGVLTSKTFENKIYYQGTCVYTQIMQKSHNI